MKDNWGRTNAIAVARLQNTRCSPTLRKEITSRHPTKCMMLCVKREPYLDSLDISKTHHVKYDYSDKSQTKFHVWQYSNIGPGKKFDIPSQPKVPKYEEKMKF